jgi:sec-independent protein translocase protein TatB
VFNVGGAELLVILLVALLVLGPNKLPDAARQVGRALGELRRMSSGFQAEMRDALREPVDGGPTSASSAGAESGGTLSSPRSSDTPATPSSPATGDSEGPAAQPEEAAPAGAGGEDGDDRAATAEGASPASASGDNGGDGGADGGAEGAPAAGGGTVTTPPARDPGANGTTPA